MKTTWMLRIAMLALLAASALAADVAGKWTGTQQGREGRTMEITLNLKAEGAALSGTMGSQMGETAITDGCANRRHP